MKKVGTRSCGGGFCLCNHLHSYKVLEKRCQMGHVFILLTDCSLILDASELSGK